MKKEEQIKAASENNSQNSLESSGEGGNGNSRPGSPTASDKLDVRLFQECYTLHMESEAFKVLMNWKKIVRSNNFALFRETHKAKIITPITNKQTLYSFQQAQEYNLINFRI